VLVVAASTRGGQLRGMEGRYLSLALGLGWVLSMGCLRLRGFDLRLVLVCPFVWPHRSRLC
jgi:hypothetical protein